MADTGEFTGATTASGGSDPTGGPALPPPQGGGGSGGGAPGDERREKPAEVSKWLATLATTAMGYVVVNMRPAALLCREQQIAVERAARQAADASAQAAAAAKASLAAAENALQNCGFPRAAWPLETEPVVLFWVMVAGLVLLGASISMSVYYRLGRVAQDPRRSPILVIQLVTLGLGSFVIVTAGVTSEPAAEQLKPKFQSLLVDARGVPRTIEAQFRPTDLDRLATALAALQKVELRMPDAERQALRASAVLTLDKELKGVALQAPPNPLPVSVSGTVGLAPNAATQVTIANPTVRLDSATSVVRMDTQQNAVKIDSTDNAVRIDDSKNEVVVKGPIPVTVEATDLSPVTTAVGEVKAAVDALAGTVKDLDPIRQARGTRDGR